MPKIIPFRAFRFNPDTAPLKRSVCPPYDIIGEKLAGKLRRSVSNAIHIELPEGAGDSKYENARKVWLNWKSQGLISQDSKPAFYVYEQIFSALGKKFTRAGFFCALRVEEPGKGSVLRHELTISGPKEDRLKLLRSLRLNTSPVFGLFKDGAGAVRNVIKSVSRSKALAEVKDSDGVTHRLWAVTDAAGIKKIQGAVAKTPVLIADGHHRYETSWNYRKERNAEGGSTEMLFFLCPMEAKGLVIFPTHRIMAGPNKKKYPQMLDLLASRQDIFAVKALPLSAVSGEKFPKGFSFVVTDGRKCAGVRISSAKRLKEILRDKSKASQDLPLVHLHSLLFPSMRKEDFIYVHEQPEALRLVRKLGSTAFLLPPTTTQELHGVVSAGELMPQKSTYFYPKIITGMVFRPLE